MKRSPTKICGAGPAGLATAIELARGGSSVTVYERRSAVGGHRCGDIEFLENWTQTGNVLEWLGRMNFDLNFTVVPIHRITIAGPKFKDRVDVESQRPIMYQVKRGSMRQTLDQGFYLQALQAGVQVRLGTSIPEAECDIVASGPAVVGGVGLGYAFQTNLSDGVYCLLDNDLAPRGYGWLCVGAGDATAAIGITDSYTQLRPCLDNFLATLQSHLHFEVRNPRRFGVYVNVAPPIYAGCKSGRLHVGEAGGFQDALLGFGMRYAIRSGYLAAQSILTGCDYESLWKKEFQSHLAAGTVNRMAAEILGSNFGYRILLLWMRTHRRDFAQFLQKHYRMTWLRRMAYILYQLSPELVGTCVFGKRRYQRQFLKLEPRGEN